MKRKPKPKLVNLPDTVCLWRRNYHGNVITIFSEKNEPLTVERINFILDRAKDEIMER